MAKYEFMKTERKGNIGIVRNRKLPFTQNKELIMQMNANQVKKAYLCLMVAVLLSATTAVAQERTPLEEFIKGRFHAGA